MSSHIHWLNFFAAFTQSLIENLHEEKNWLINKKSTWLEVLFPSAFAIFSHLLASTSSGGNKISSFSNFSWKIRIFDWGQSCSSIEGNIFFWRNKYMFIINKLSEKPFNIMARFISLSLKSLSSQIPFLKPRKQATGRKEFKRMYILHIYWEGFVCRNDIVDSCSLSGWPYWHAECSHQVKEKSEAIIRMPTSNQSTLLRHFISICICKHHRASTC